MLSVCQVRIIIKWHLSMYLLDLCFYLLYSWDLSIVLHMEVNNETLEDIRYPSADCIIATGEQETNTKHGGCTE